jgi:hypothetical protein
MEQKLNWIERQIFEISYAVGCRKFSRESGIKLYNIQKIRNKAKQLGISPNVDVNKKYSFTEDERYNLFIQLEQQGFFDNTEQ